MGALEGGFPCKPAQGPALNRVQVPGRVPLGLPSAPLRLRQALPYGTVTHRKPNRWQPPGPSSTMGVVRNADP
ncbi:hypothetical protein ATOP_16980 [Granulimonas faecalis]|uniref:Uncharacterized protein n=1 Tax=Granulimonas faecalis TaxID=2894155 RepID=A0AAV5B7I2_9ACTN|nr:hypothetical protein ATOP_16980 [Granulimonas faecalis]